MNRASRSHRALVAAALAPAGLLLWQGVVRWFDLPEYLLPAPTVVASRFWATLAAQAEHLSVTAATTLVGLAAAVLVGLPLAMLVVYVPPLKTFILSAFAAFNGIPKIAVAPLLVTWFGLGAESKILLAFLLGLFPVFVNAVTGLGDIDPDVIDLSRLAGGTEVRIFRLVRLMHALPYLSDAVKVAFPLALVGSIVGEFIGGNEGIGYLILSAQSNLDTPLVFACLLSITLFTSAAMGALALFEKALLSWRPSARTAEA